MREAELEASSVSIGDGDLHDRLERDGYLFFPRLIDPDIVRKARADVLGALEGVGWLASGSTLDDAVPSAAVRREEADVDPAFFDAYRAIQRLQEFHELAHHAALTGLMRRLVGPDLLVHPRKIARIGLPQDAYVVGAHQDFPLNQGSVDVLTAWIPLGDCADDLGGLRVLAGSHRAGLRAVEPVPRVGGLRVAERLEDRPGWLSADFTAGDVLVFHSLTVHAAKANRTQRLRLSVDFRYQSAADPVAEGSLVPHYYPVVPSHEDLSIGWSRTDAVAVPDGLSIVPGFDPFSGPDGPVQSRLIAADA